MIFRSLAVCVLFAVGIYAHNGNETEMEVSKEDKRCQPNCTFDIDFLTSSTLKDFPRNCFTVCTSSSLYIGDETDLTEKQLTDTFKNMKHLVGDLIVTGTKYNTSNFLSSLETVDCDNNGTFQWSYNDKMTEIGLPNLSNVSCCILIKYNKNLTRLNLPKMVPILSPTANFATIDVGISENSRDFCITVQEMENLMTYDYIEFSKITGKYCEPLNTTNSAPKICVVQNTTIMESGCAKIVGDVKIQGEIERYAEKIESVETIFGSLTIGETNLTNTKYFQKLQHVVSLKENQHAIQIEYNPLLTDVSLPSLRRVQSLLYVPIVFNNNSEELLNHSEFCYAIRNSITGKPLNWIVKFNDMTCEEVEKAATITRDKSAKTSLTTSVLLFVVFVNFILNAR